MSIRRYCLAVLFLAIASLFATVGTQASGQQNSKTQNNEQIEKLLHNQEEVLRNLVEVYQRKYERGLCSMTDLSNVKIELSEVQLKLAKSKDERIKVLQARFESFKEIEFRATELQKVGAKGGELELVLRATSNRLAAEIEMLKESAE